MLSVNLVKAYVREICEVRIDLRHLAPYAWSLFCLHLPLADLKRGIT